MFLKSRVEAKKIILNENIENDIFFSWLVMKIIRLFSTDRSCLSQIHLSNNNMANNFLRNKCTITNKNNNSKRKKKQWNNVKLLTQGEL